MSLVSEMGPLDCLVGLVFVLALVAYAAHKGWRRG